MTRQESFKKRVRTRMATTGERYVEARRILLTQAADPGVRRPWIAQPELSDEAIRARTGKGWDAWCDLIEQFPRREEGHRVIANYLRDDVGVDAWSAQSITVGVGADRGPATPAPDGRRHLHRQQIGHGDR